MRGGTECAFRYSETTISDVFIATIGMPRRRNGLSVYSESTIATSGWICSSNPESWTRFAFAIEASTLNDFNVDQPLIPPSLPE